MAAKTCNVCKDYNCLTIQEQRLFKSSLNTPGSLDL